MTACISQIPPMRVQPAAGHPLDALLKSASIALEGASLKANTPGNTMLRAVRCWAATVTCARARSSASTATFAWTASGKAPLKFSVSWWTYPQARHRRVH